MHVFLTGATGYVGAAVARALRAGGHEVAALARSPAAAARVAAAGLRPVPGSLRDLDGLGAAARAADVVVHAGFEYDARGEECADVDAAAIEALLAGARAGADATGAPRQVIYTSNAFLLRSAGGDPVREDADPATMPPSWRFAVERRVLDAHAADVTTAVLRLGLVYGGGVGGSGPSLFAGALRHGAPPYVGDGRARWSCVHLDDLAALYVRVAERRASGVLHGVDGTPMRVRDVMAAVGRAAGLARGPEPVAPALGEALLGEHTVGHMTRDVAVGTARALALGWRPRHASFAEGAASAFAAWRAGTGGDAGPDAGAAHASPPTGAGTDSRAG